MLAANDSPGPAASKLFENLRRLRFLTPAQLEELSRTQEQFPDSQALIQEIMDRGWLSLAQIEQLTEFTLPRSVVEVGGKSVRKNPQTPTGEGALSYHRKPSRTDPPTPSGAPTDREQGSAKPSAAPASTQEIDTRQTLAGEVRSPTNDVKSDQVVPGGGGYRKLKFLGRGTFADVWLAEAPGGVQVALKMIKRPIDHAEAQNELKALELVRGLRHPFLLQTQAYWTVEDQLYIAMELADGSLRDRLKACKARGQESIPLDDLLLHIRQAAEALDFLHTHRVQHRDIKPENILLVENYVKVADFGLARSHAGSLLLASMTVGGTPVYMAPEVWHGKNSPHTDQYSLAMTYAEMRLGRRVIRGNDLFSLMTAHASGEIQLEPMPRDEQKAVLKALAAEPGNRYPSCVAFVEAVEKACRPAPTPRTVPPTPPPARQPLLVPLGLLLLVAVGVLLWLALPRRDRAVTFQVEAPAPLVLLPGEKRTVALQLRRQQFAAPIVLKPRAVPTSVKIESPGDENAEAQVPFQIVVAPDAPPGDHLITFDADSGGQHQEVVLSLDIVYMPSPEWQRVGDSKTMTRDRYGHRYCQRIARRFGDERVEMILIRRWEASLSAGKPDLETYYIMETKVQVGLFQHFARTDKKIRLEWEKWSEDKQLPVRDVSVTDAHQFALWFGGYLPTTDQWDKAAGLYSKGRGEGPYRGKWDAENKLHIGVGGLLAPLPPAKTEDDISPEFCRDMAGNGFEWTRNLDKESAFVPADQPATAMVRLRGRGFKQKEPLTYAQLEAGMNGMQPYPQTRPDISFRVVLEPPLLGTKPRTSPPTQVGNP